MKRSYSLFLSATLSIAWPLFSDSPGSDQNEEEMIRSAFPSQSPSGEMFASAQAQKKTGWDVAVYGDWIYWKAAEEGLDYGVQTTNPGTSETKSIRGGVCRVTPEYHSGNRIGLDVTFPHDAWDILIQWTRYQNKNTDSREVHNGKSIWPTYLNENGAPSALSAFAKWDLSYGVLDLELGRSFFVGEHLSIRPFFSFEAAWIKQKLKIVYGQINFDDVTNQAYIRSNNHNHFKGYGLRAGLDTKWPLNGGISLFGDLSFSLLYSEFEMAQFEKNADSTPRTHLKDRLHLATRVVQMAGGIQWERLVYKEQLLFCVHAGWEQQIWFDQNQLNLFLNSSGTALGETLNQQGNLTLSGLTLGATFSF